MSVESNSYGKATDLLHQLENILESDALIDELGFIHPSQFSFLNQEYADELYFWNRDHKLGISTHILLPLYKASKHAFMTAFQQYNMRADDHLESKLLRHSRSLLLISCDFMTAWNCRKLLVCKNKQVSMFVDELLLSELVLSYSAKSEQAWSHRRWVIKSISANSSNLEEILAKESELVEKIAEVLYEMRKSRSWAALHVSDNCCFHYRRRLLQKMMEEQSCTEETASYGHNPDIVQAMKALWLHRRFLSSCWINSFLTNSNDGSYHSKEATSMYHDFGTFLQKELSLFHASTFVDDDYGDFQAQATHSASYILWLKVQLPKPLENEFLEKIKDVDLKTLLDKSCPERSSLFNYFMS